MIERIQVEREARAYMARGEWEKAITLYRELLESREADPNIYNLIGDIYTKMNELADAIPEYLSAIDLYEADGLYENGIAVCKKIMRLMPDVSNVYFKLAIFYTEIGLLNEAKDALINYTERSKDWRIVDKEMPKYKKLMILLASNERIRPVVEPLYVKIGRRERDLDAIFGLIPPQSEEVTKESTEPAFIEDTQLSISDQKITPIEEKEEIPKHSQIDEIAPFTHSPVAEITHNSHEREFQAINESRQPATPEPVSVDEEGKKFVPSEEEVQLLLRAIEEIKVSDFTGPSKTHYELGLQYKSLGFYDAAIREFQLSSTMEPQKIKALKEVGYCFLEKNQPNIAVNAFKRAIEEGGKGSEDYIALKYGIGTAYELIGDKVKAIELFEEVYLHDIHYRDVKEKLTRLKGSV